MRRFWMALPTLLLVLCASSAYGKFGMFKTKVILMAPRPPEIPLLAEKVFVDVRSDVGQRHATQLRQELEEALRAEPSYQLVDNPRAAGAQVQVTLHDLRADIRDEVRTETQRVKVGEREEWNEKKKKYETKDVYGDREISTTWTLADGELDGLVEVDPGDGRSRTHRLSARYSQEKKRDGGLPREMSSEESLRRYLLDSATAEAVAVVSVQPTPLEVLLAVNGELKTGNKLAEDGNFREALAAWNRKTYKGDTEAARLHNLGVAYEALAYRLSPFHPEHLDLLTKAQESYQRARALDADEKYFNPPLERIEVSLRAAHDALAQQEEIERFRKAANRPTPAPAPQPAPVLTTQAEAAPPPAPAPQARSARPRAAATSRPAPALRNGSFDAALQGWSMVGKGNLVAETGRGKVLELNATSGTASVGQSFDPALTSASSLKLDYRVTAGEPHIRIRVGYRDAEGHERDFTLQVSAGEGPGGWSSWATDLRALRPKPAQVHDVQVEAEGGSVRLDAVDVR